MSYSKLNLKIFEVGVGIGVMIEVVLGLLDFFLFYIFIDIFVGFFFVVKERFDKVKVMEFMFFDISIDLVS